MEQCQGCRHDDDKIVDRENSQGALEVKPSQFAKATPVFKHRVFALVRKAADDQVAAQHEEQADAVTAKMQVRAWQPVLKKDQQGGNASKSVKPPDPLLWQ